MHEALFYLDVQDYATRIAAFLRDGFELAEPALVAVPGSHVDVLRSVLCPEMLCPEIGQRAERVRFVNMAEAGRNPGRIIPTVLCSFTHEHPAGRVRANRSGQDGPPPNTAPHCNTNPSTSPWLPGGDHPVPL